MAKREPCGRVLVTGASGFLGRFVTAHLREAGWEVFGVGRRPAFTFPGGEAHYLRCDLSRSASSVRRMLSEVGPQAVVHLAAGVMGQADSNRRGVIEQNARMTEHLLAAFMGQACPPKVVLVSSSAVYGPGNPRGAISERHPLRPVTLYGVSKVTLEMLGNHAAARGLRVVCARLFNLVGPGQGGNFVVPALLRNVSGILAGVEPPEIELSTPNSARDFVDVRDAAAGVFLLLKKGDAGGIYNLCSGRATRIVEVLRLLLRSAGLGKKVRVSEREDRQDLIPYQRGNAGKIRALGWRPRFSLRDSIADAWKARNGKGAL